MPHDPTALQVDRLVWDRARPPLSFGLGQSERLYLCGEGAAKLLLVLAGFVDPAAGAIHCEGRSLIGVKVPARHVAYIPPGDSLIPRHHLRANVALPGAGRARAVSALRRLGLEDLGRRMPGTLDAGQRRLGALARALAAEPALLLVAEGDDPPAISQALADFPAPPAIVATDNVAVALARAHRILLLQGGVLSQLAGPREMFERPSDRFAASWTGPCNLIPATLDGHGPYPGSVVAVVSGQLMLARFRESASGPVVLAVRPHLLAVTESGVPVTVQGLDFQGAITRLRVALPDGTDATLDSAAPPAVAPGDTVAVGWAWTDAWPVPA